jgi:hypothetical protein
MFNRVAVNGIGASRLTELENELETELETELESPALPDLAERVADTAKSTRDSRGLKGA